MTNEVEMFHFRSHAIEVGYKNGVRWVKLQHFVGALGQTMQAAEQMMTRRRDAFPRSEIGLFPVVTTTGEKIATFITTRLAMKLAIHSRSKIGGKIIDALLDLGEGKEGAPARHTHIAPLTPEAALYLREAQELIRRGVPAAQVMQELLDGTRCAGTGPVADVFRAEEAAAKAEIVAAQRKLAAVRRNAKANGVTRAILAWKPPMQGRLSLGGGAGDVG
jgi:hypothetical protein